MVLMTKAAASAATSTTAVVSEKVGLSLAGQVFFGSLCAGTFGLGVWQTRRYFEKVDIVAARQAALRQDPTTELPLLDTTADGNGNDAVVFRRIHLQGYYLHDYEFLVGPRGAPAGSLPEKKSASSATTTAAPSQQGYFVLTPFVVTHKVPTTTSLDGNSNNELVVIVNRGWVPRQMAVFPQQQKQSQRQGYANNNNNNNKTSDEPAPPPRLSTVRRATVRRQDLQQRRQSSSTNKNTDIDYLDWERPSVPPLTSLTVVPAPHEKPRFIVAQHDNVVQRQQHHHQQQQQQQHRNGNSSNNNNVEDALPPPPPKLFWFDRKAMKEITAASNILSPVQQKMPTLLVLTAVKNDSESDDDNDDNKNVNDKPQQQQQQQVLPCHLWPAVPPAHRVGEPKVTPMIHVGYAVTWYGLSAAGLYMTRKLMTRGR